MRAWRFIATTVAALLATHTLQAQAPREAVLAAAQYVRTNSDLRAVKAGDLVLDRRVADGVGKLTTLRARAETAAILRALGARMGLKEREIACTGPESKDCKLLGRAKGVVALSDARVDGEKATVDVHMWLESDGGSEPVSTKHMIVDLERLDGAWRVKGDRPLRISEARGDGN